MNTKTRKTLTLGAVLTFCLFSLGRSASAQNNNNCMNFRGNSVLVFDNTGANGSGPVRNAGFLNGTLTEVVHSCCGVTPNPNVVSLLSDLTFTANHGQLKASMVLASSILPPFAYTEFGPIDPNTSTGRFAGATGMIFVTGKSIGDALGPFEEEITGEVCFAN